MENRDTITSLFNKFYEENTFLHGYSKSVLHHVYINSLEDKNELILSFQRRYSGALEVIKELTLENEKLKEENKDLQDRVSAR